MTGTQPLFLITIDTEGDNLWSKPRRITTENSRFLGRFQQLCERFGFPPTYLTNYEMACCPVYREFARDCLRRGTAEVGMHLHAWNSPPLEPLTSDDHTHQPLLIEFPEDRLREKVDFLTRLLQDRFETPMLSHRAGRWSFDGIYARALLDYGYKVDCSVTPLVSWAERMGREDSTVGSDYTRCPNQAYFMDLADIRRPGSSGLIEVPMTVMHLGPPAVQRVQERLAPDGLPARVLSRLYPRAAWLRPTGRNLSEMLRLVERATETGHSYVEFMLHSSEFMPGGSPAFPNQEAIERLYRDMERLFAEAARTYRGATLTDFWRGFTGRSS